MAANKTELETESDYEKGKKNWLKQNVSLLNDVKKGGKNMQKKHEIG